MYCRQGKTDHDIMPIDISAARYVDVSRLSPYIFVAVPWTPVGGGMFKVADYLIQSQSLESQKGSAQLRPLDTRGAAGAGYSLWVLLQALVKLVLGRIGGGLVGVHVNMAERMSLFRKGLVVIVCRALRIPVVLHLHAAQLHHTYRRMSRPLRALTRWVFSLPSACIVLGATSRRFVIDELTVAADKVEVVMNGVPEPTVPRRQRVDSDGLRVLFLGNLLERKGVVDLLHALVSLKMPIPQLKVNIAGGGDIEGYRTLAKKLGIDNVVTFDGWVDQAKASRLLADADVLILPSYDEGLPLVILEALANGVAVVCTPVGEVPAVFTDQVDACFVRPGDIESIADGLRRVLDDPYLRRNLEQNGRRMYERQFSFARFFENISRIHLKHFGTCAQAKKSSGR